MVRPAYYDRNGIKKGAWSVDEDFKLWSHIVRFGHCNWRLVPILAGLTRCGKSCRLRWMNYLKPGLRRGNFTTLEDDLIFYLHAEFGNKWSAIAARLPGRTDNEVKNHWHAHLKKRRSRQQHAPWVPRPEQYSETSLPWILSPYDDHHQESDFLSTPTNPQNKNMGSQIPHDSCQVSQIFTKSRPTNQVHRFIDSVLQFEDDEGQICLDMSTLFSDELIMPNSPTNDSMNSCPGNASYMTGITSSIAKSLHLEALMHVWSGRSML